MPQRPKGRRRKSEGMGGLAKGLAIVEAFSAHPVMSVATQRERRARRAPSARPVSHHLTELAMSNSPGGNFAL